MGRQRTLDELTGLRFFLAIWVVVYHQIPLSAGVGIPWWPEAPTIATLILRCGYVAVTGFFVLSGFVLSYSYEAGTAAWPESRKWKFWAARLARIYPGYIAGLALMLPLILFRSTKVANSQDYLREHALSGLWNVLLVQAWIPGQALTWNFPGWSLSDEAFFYVVFPLMAWRLAKVRTWMGLTGFWLLSLLMPLWALWAGLPGGKDVAASYSILEEDLWIQAVRYLPLVRVAEFGMGVILGQWFRSRGGLPLTWSGLWTNAGLVGLLGLLAGAAVIPHPLMHNGLAAPCFALLIAGLAGGGGLLGKLLRTRVLVFLGGASYAMYILHSPLESYCGILWKYFIGTVMGSTIWVFTYVTVVVAVASCFHAVVEERLTRALRARLERRVERWAQQRNQDHGRN